jgi:Methyl-accepting chemotaxis protein (MCP) signalling domain
MEQERSRFEIAYTRKVNTTGFLFLLAHLPVLAAMALFQGSSIVVPVLVMALLLSAPTAILLRDRSAVLAADALAVAAMGTSALAIHVAGGMLEAHFEIFTLLAMLTVFGRIAPLLIAATTIALHHVIFWLWLPSSLFSYKASLAIVLLHAFFVVLEVVPACWIALQFGRSVRGQGMVLERLGGAAEQIASAAREIAASSQTLSEGASQQAAAIEQTSASTTEIDAMVKRTTANSSSTAAIVTEADRHAQGTARSLTEMVTTMHEISAASEQIAGIVKVIDQIAFQSNILALNAAVEAARAGNAGLGFGVVAEEVRNLSKRSAEAARQTASLIEDSMAKTRTGLSKVEELALEMRAMSSRSAEIKQLIDEIEVGSQEQSEGMHQVSSAIQQMEKVTQVNAAAAEQTAAAAEELASQSQAIREVVRHFAAMSASVA